MKESERSAENAAGREAEETGMTAEQDNNRKYHRKLALRFIVFLVAAAVVLLILNLVLDKAGDGNTVKPEDAATESVQLFEPDFERDIFEDEFYTELERWINYTFGGMTTRVFSIDDAKKTDLFAEFFFRYFDALTHGRYEGFDSFFTEDYLKRNGRFDRFTMQQIYDISVEYLGSDSDDQTGDRYYDFRVTFAIRRNDGTVFPYMPSNKTLPYLYRIVESANRSEWGIDLIKR